MDLPLRPLLLDCRIELRKALRNYEQSELAQRLETALTLLAPPEAGGPSAARADAGIASRSAYAWQMAARTLKTTHPTLFGELQREVQRLLDSGAPADANAEIERLQQDLEAAEAAAGAAKLARMKATAQLNTVCKALAAVAPQVPEQADAQSTALARIDVLVQGLGVAATAQLAGVRAEAADPESVPPPGFVLELVKLGQRSFNKAQREFAVAEAMIVTGWQFTPVELLGRGEPWLAALLLDPEATD